jgi:signal transduction histidine kinase
MRERALLAGGRLDVRTVPGAGTTIELVVAAKPVVIR